MRTSDWQDKVNRLLVEAGKLDRQNKVQQAVSMYEQAYQLIPEPKHASELAMAALCSIGELNYLQGKWNQAFQDFSEAVKCKEGLGNPQIHIRLGQLQYELGNMLRAEDELMRAYMGSGHVIFEGEDPKYYELISQYIENS